MNDKNETRRQLPEGWRWVRLGEICDFSYGSSLPAVARQNGDVPVYGSNGITGYHSETLTKGETIIVGRKGSIGEVHFSPVPCYPIDTTYFIEKTKVEADLVWLFYLLRSLNLYELNKAAAIPGLNRSDAYQIEIPLPRLDEQKRIAAILQEQLAAVQKARTAAKEQLNAVRSLPSAYLRQVFNNPEAETWQRKKLGQVAKVQSGYAFKTDWYTNEGVRLLRNANVFQGFIDWGDCVKLGLEQRPKFAAYELQEGDIILSLDRPLVSNGLKVAKLTVNDIPSLLLQRVGRFQINENLSSDYLFAFLNSENFIQEIKGHDQSLGVPHISPSQVESIEIPVPPIEKQKKIAERLTAQMQAVETARKQLEEQLAAIERLPAKLLERAFNGEV